MSDYSPYQILASSSSKHVVISHATKLERVTCMGGTGSGTLTIYDRDIVIAQIHIVPGLECDIHMPACRMNYTLNGDYDAGKLIPGQIEEERGIWILDSFESRRRYDVWRAKHPTEVSIEDEYEDSEWE